MEGKATDQQLRRAARNQSIFREVNEKLEGLAENFQAVSETAPFTCECADLGCIEMIDMTLSEYETIRKEPNNSSSYLATSTPSSNGSCQKTNATSWLRNTTKAASSQRNWTLGRDNPETPEDAEWLRKLIAACDKALEQLHVDTGTTTLHADMVSLRADLSARLERLDAEDAA